MLKTAGNGIKKKVLKNARKKIIKEIMEKLQEGFVDRCTFQYNNNDL